MTAVPTTGPSAPPATRGDDRGYVVALTALLILPLLAFAGFATDIGSWYAQASRMQRAADAAALAGVAHLPDVTRATAVAADTAERNGYVDGVDGITITITQVGPHQLNVEIVDAEADMFFASLVIESISITRNATAEYVLPLAMGSPSNSFGNEGLGPYPGQPNFYAAVNAPYTDRRQGDPISTRCDRSNSSTRCLGALNPTYDPEGYLYAVEIPPGAADVDIELFDAGFSNRPLTVETGDFDFRVGPAGRNGVSTDFLLYDTDLTPLSHLDNVPMTAAQCEGRPARLNIPATAGTGRNAWTSLCHLTRPTPGTYPLRIRSYGDGYASNQFSIRATSSTAARPRVYGVGSMSIYASASSGTTQFYLADVSEVHRGKKLRVDLFDPGESTGQADLSLLGPGGSTVDCSVSVNGGSPTTYAPCTIQTSTRAGRALFDGDELTIYVDLDPTYTCAADCWWRVSYHFARQAHDRTTWSARIIGDPVHLVRAGG